jgi:hypothetical protein
VRGMGESRSRSSKADRRLYRLEKTVASDTVLLEQKNEQATPAHQLATTQACIHRFPRASISAINTGNCVTRQVRDATRALHGALATERRKYQEISA